MANVDLYSAIIMKVSNALNTLVSGEKPGFRALSKGLIVLLCAKVVRQGVPDHGAVHSEWSHTHGPTYMAVARSSSGGVEIRYVFPVFMDEWMTSYMCISQGSSTWPPS